jgi:hypothetical protein
VQCRAGPVRVHDTSNGMHFDCATKATLGCTCRRLVPSTTPRVQTQAATPTHTFIHSFMLHLWQKLIQATPTHSRHIRRSRRLCAALLTQSESITQCCITALTVPPRPCYTPPESSVPQRKPHMHNQAASLRPSHHTAPLPADTCPHSHAYTHEPLMNHTLWEARVPTPVACTCRPHRTRGQWGIKTLRRTYTRGMYGSYLIYAYTHEPQKS